MSNADSSPVSGVRSGADAVAGIETGGTKVFCAVSPADNPHEIVDSLRVDTRDPESTLGDIADFLGRHHVRTPIRAVGVASFGPVDTNPASPHYGSVTTTPKPGWAFTDLRRALAGLDPVPVSFVTDVTGSLLGERARGALQGLDDAAYVTVGTGVGAGVMVHGELVTGQGTPELGHILVRRDADDPFAGRCPFHGDCLEGLVSGPAVQDRWGRPARDAAEVELLAGYVAQLCLTLTLSVAPRRIVVGGGVSKTPGLLPAARRRLASLVGGYLGSTHPAEDPEGDYIVPPALGDLSGVHGALDLAASLLR